MSMQKSRSMLRAADISIEELNDMKFQEDSDDAKSDSSYNRNKMKL